MSRVLVVDNYDSFVYNLVQYLAQLGADCDVRRNDAVTPREAGSYDGVLLSPGPGIPERAGVCVDLVKHVAGRVPVLGVCLGHQAVAVACGGAVDTATELLHGKTSQVHHDGSGVLYGIASPFNATRYHSLIVERDSLPPELAVTGETESGLVMALRHRDLPIEGVQFHPESVLTDSGHQLLGNWLAVCGDADAPARAAGLSPLRT